MELWRKYLLSNVYRSPEGEPAPAADPPAPQPPPAAAGDAPQPDPAKPAEPAAGDPDATAEPAEPHEHGNKGKKPWFLDRISEEAAGRRAAEARNAELEAELRKRAAPADPAAAPAPTADAPVDFNRAVDAAAEQKLFVADTVTVLNNGVAKFQDFDQTRSILGALGALDDGFVKDVLGVDKANAHVILDKLAKAPEKTAALVKMDSRARIAELTRLSMAATAPVAEPAANTLKPAVPTKGISKAPAPPPPVEPSASKVVDWRSDQASDEDFDRGYREMMVQRSKRR